MKKILRRLLQIAILLPILLAAVWYLFNFRDEALSPELEKILAAAPPPQIPATENGYFAWVGIMGPESSDPHEWGQRYVAQMLASEKAFVDPSVPIAEADNLLVLQTRERRSEWYKGYKDSDLPCRKPETCLESVAADLDKARLALERGRVTLTRYDRALTYPAVQSPWRPDMSAKSPLPITSSDLVSLAATRFALAIAEGRIDEALEQLGREIRFHEMQLSGAAESIFDAMVAVSNMKRRLDLLDQFMSRHPSEAMARLERIAPLLESPLPRQNVSLERALAGEVRMLSQTPLILKGKSSAEQVAFVKSVLISFASEPPRMTLFALDYGLIPLMLHNATANALFAEYSPWLGVEAVSGDDYRTALAGAKSAASQLKDESLPLRNTFGKLAFIPAFLGVGTFDLSPSFLRRDDLLAYRSLLAFRLDQMRHGWSDPEAIGQAVASSSPRLAHPYTGEQPKWDTGTRTLAYADNLTERNGRSPPSIRFSTAGAPVPDNVITSTEGK